MSDLFKPIKFKGITINNRVMMSPMCMYSAKDGVVSDFHIVHLGARAMGKVGLIMVEATGVNPEGRISPYDAGIWDKKHIEAFKPIVKFCKAQGSVMGIQLAHAGRKASTDAPWFGEGPVKPENGGWQTFAPSAIPFDNGYPAPKEMDAVDIKKVIDDFTKGAKNADQSGFDIIEIHAAHGYLLNEFLSPVSNKRNDSYGGSLENRAKLLIEIINSIKKVWPENKPIFVRISAIDWIEGGFNLTDSIALAKMLKKVGVSLIDCSSGGIAPNAKMNIYHGYQLTFAREIREKASMPVAAIGLVTTPELADFVIHSGTADMVAMARELLRNPYWVLNAARELNSEITWPNQYLRAKL